MTCCRRTLAAAVSVLAWWAASGPALAAVAAITPRHYALSLVPDLGRGTFSGRETIDVELAGPTDRIELDSVGLQIIDATVVVDGVAQAAVASGDDAHQTLRLRRCVGPGAAQITVAWSGRLDDDMVGFYRGRAHGRAYALTDFEPDSARRAFPCFDSPALKATMTMSTVIATDEDAISNSDVAEVTPLPHGQKLVRFAPTPPLPTYLFALAVGKWRSVGRVVDGTTIRLWTSPEDAAYGAFALDEAAQLLPRLISYFAAPYPFHKLDLLAVPSLVPNGMENAGAILLRADRVLLDRASASPVEWHAAARLIAHELAHQWLGDLVTPRWWDDLWLNEATANFVANETLGELHPGFAPWLDFQQPFDEALDEDELAGARPIRSAVTDTTARDPFDRATYIKGPAVLRMLDHWLGAGTVKRALVTYLRARRAGVGDTDDFLAALDQASGSTASALARVWLERAGHPLLAVDGACQSGDFVVTMTQSPAGVGSSTNTAPWPIPVSLRWPGGARTIVMTTTRATATITGCPAWLDANAARAGVYRVHYAHTLAVALQTAAQQLDPAERTELVSDAWTDVRRGASSLVDFLGDIERAAPERSPAVLAQLGRRLAFIDDELLPPASRGDFARFLARAFQASYETLGLTPRPDDDDDTRVARALLLELLGRAGSVPEILANADAALARFEHDERSIDPALVPTVLDLTARAGGPRRFGRFVRALKNSGPAEQRRYLDALAVFRPPRLQQALQLLLSGDIPVEDLMPFAASLLARGRQSSLVAWRFLAEHFDVITQRMPRLGWLLTPSRQLCDERAERSVSRFFGDERHRPIAQRRLRDVEESIAECTALRQREMASVTAWLRQRR